MSLAAEALLHRVRDFLCPAGLAKVFLVGLIVRLVIAPWTYCPFDTYPFYSASVDMLAGMGMYGHAVYSYPPGFGIVLYPFMYVLSLFLDPSLFGSFQPGMVEVGAITGTVNPFVTAPAFNLAYKAPLILGDILTASTLYLLARDWKGEGAGRAAYALWFLNPLVIWISAVVGQFDVLAVLCTVVAVYFFLRDRYALAGVALGAGALLKIYPAYLALLFLAFLLVDRRTRQGLAAAGRLVGGIFASLLVAVPFLHTTPAMLDFVLRRAGNDNFGGINIWFFCPLTGHQVVEETLGVVSTQAVPAPLIVLVIGLILTVAASLQMARSGRPRREALLTGCLLIMVIALLFRSLTNPQHLLWALPFLGLATLADPRFRAPFYLLTLSGLLASLALRSFAVFFYPLAVYTPLLEVEQLNGVVLSYFSHSGIIGHDLAFVAACAVGVVALVAVLLPSYLDPVERVRERLWGARE